MYELTQCSQQHLRVGAAAISVPQTQTFRSKCPEPHSQSVPSWGSNPGGLTPAPGKQRTSEMRTRGVSWCTCSPDRGNGRRGRRSLESESWWHKTRFLTCLSLLSVVFYSFIHACMHAFICSTPSIKFENGVKYQTQAQVVALFLLKLSQPRADEEVVS